jgi:polar amino acid transport system substrate-binding protein
VRERIVNYSKLIAFLLLPLFPVNARAQSTKLLVGVDEYCPYTCLKSDKNKGYALDLVEQILAPRGYVFEYVPASWPRIKAMARKGALDLLIPVNQAETRELEILRTRLAINQLQKESPAAYFVHKDSKWIYTGPESLKDQTIGIVQGYTYPEPLHSHLQDPQYQSKQIVLASDQGNQRQIRMLASRRVTVVPSERLVFWYIARQMGLETEFKDAGVLQMPDELVLFHIGIVQKNKPQSRNLQQWLDEGLEAMKNGDKLKSILKKYNL